MYAPMEVLEVESFELEEVDEEAGKIQQRENLGSAISITRASVSRAQVPIGN